MSNPRESTCREPIRVENELYTVAERFETQRRLHGQRALSPLHFGQQLVQISKLVHEFLYLFPLGESRERLLDCRQLFANLFEYSLALFINWDNGPAEGIDQDGIVVDVRLD